MASGNCLNEGEHGSCVSYQLRGNSVMNDQALAGHGADLDLRRAQEDTFVAFF